MRRSPKDSQTLPVLRSVSLLLSGTAGGALLSLLRNLLIARLLPIEDYGIAATFAIAVSVVEMLSTLGLQQQIVQAREGGNPRFQAALQSFHLLRGLIAGACLMLAAGPIAAFLNIPEVAWAYQVMALVPVLLGLTHYDIHRLKRQMRFGPEITTQVIPHAVALLAVWPLYQWLPDYRLMLVVIVGHAALTALASHLVAERAYKLAFDKEVIAGAVRFGWPLLVNNLLLFLVFNGEKLIVGRELGMADLAILAMGFTLTLTPTLVLGKAAQSFFLPQLSTAREDRARFNDLATVTLQATLAAALLFLAAVVLLGRPVVLGLLGAEYLALVPLIIWLAILQTLRVLKTTGSIVALADAQTTNAMWANGFRLLTLPVAFVAAVEGAGLLTIIWIAIIGEVCGLIVSFVLVRRRAGVRFEGMALPGVLAGAVIVCAAGLAGWQAGGLAGGLAGGAPDSATLWPGVPEAAGFMVLCGLALWALKPFWHYVKQRRVVHFDT